MWSRKLSRIIRYAPDIKRFFFVEGKHRSSEYEKFMRELTLFTMSGKNLHDDAPDACAMLVDFITGGVKMVTVAKEAVLIEKKPEHSPRLLSI